MKSSRIYYILPSLVLAALAPAAALGAQSGDPAPAPSASSATPAQGDTSVQLTAATFVQQTIRAKLDQHSPSKKSETPNVSDNSTSLLDRSSAPDLVGLALNLAGLSGSTSDDRPPSSASVTFTPFTLLAAFKNENPLRPEFYNGNRLWRRYFFTLGYDRDGSSDEMSDATASGDRTTILGFKALLLDRRDASTNLTAVEALSEDVARSAFARADIDEAITNIVANAITEEQLRVLGADLALNSALNALIAKEERAVEAFKKCETDLKLCEVSNPLIDAAPDDNAKKEMARSIRLKHENALADLRDYRETYRASLASGHTQLKDLLGAPKRKTSDQGPGSAGTRAEILLRAELENYLKGPNFGRVLDLLGPTVRARLEDAVATRIETFEIENADTLALIERIRRRPQFSVAFNSKLRGMGADEYQAEAIFEYGLVNRVNLTLNGSFEYVDNPAGMPDSRGGRVGADLQYQITRETKLSGKDPVTLNLSAYGKWMSMEDSEYKSQAKLEIPIASGITIPVSVTFANRSDLINEKEVRGTFGFTIDISKLKSLVGK